MISLVTLGRAPRADLPLSQALRDYIDRSRRMAPAQHIVLADEAAFTRWLQANAPRPSSWLVLLDRRGKLLESETLAAELRHVQDAGQRKLVFAIGPHNGWSADSLARADLTLSFGRMTLPHELAAVVTAEQIYRALTILAGHPYHLGH